MQIKNIKLKNDLMLAPLAGFSDVGFRYLVIKYGCSLTCTEMVSAKGLCYNSKNTFNLLVTNKLESPKAVQLFGSEPEFMYKAVQDERLKKFDIIDINMGCPVPKIVKNHEGSYLMTEPNLAAEIVDAVKKGANGRPVTVKFRKGFKINENSAAEFAKVIEKAGADAVTVHGRTREQFYSGPADWQAIKEVKDTVDIPVIANGDVFSKEDYQNIKRVTNCDGVMIARGAIGKPFLFADILGKNYNLDLKNDILKHIEILLKYVPERVVVNDMKKHICKYAQNVENTKQIKLEACDCKELEQMISLINNRF